MYLFFCLFIFLFYLLPKEVRCFKMYSSTITLIKISSSDAQFFIKLGATKLSTLSEKLYLN